MSTFMASIHLSGSFDSSLAIPTGFKPVIRRKALRWATFNSFEQLEQVIDLTVEEGGGAKTAAEHLKIRISLHIPTLIKPEDTTRLGHRNYSIVARSISGGIVREGLRQSGSGLVISGQ